MLSNWCWSWDWCKCGKKFAVSGYHSVISRRTNQQGLDDAVKNIEKEGGSATGFLINAIEENSIENLIEKVEETIGSIHVVVFNLGSQIGNRSLNETSEKVFERGWRMATLALFRTAKKLSLHGKKGEEELFWSHHLLRR